MRISDWSSDVCSSDLRVRTFAREDHVVVAPGSDLFDEAISDEQLDYIILTIASRPDVLFYWFTNHAQRPRHYLLALPSYPHTPASPPRPTFPLATLPFGSPFHAHNPFPSPPPYLFLTPPIF